MKRLLRIPFLALVAAATARAESPAPKIALSVDGHLAPTAAPQALWRGEPVIVGVVLRHPDPDSKAPISLEPPEGGWATRVKIVVKDAGGAVVAWPFVVAGKPSGGALALQPGAVTTLVLRIDAASLASLAKGRFRLVARLELQDGRGWQGEVQSAAAEVDVIEPPAAPAGAELGRRQIRRVQDALLAGDFPRAEAAAGEMLFAGRERSEGWVALALVLEAKGQLREALSAIEKAIPLAAGATAKEPGPVPPEYEDLRRRLEGLVADSDAKPGEPATPGPK
ncbi:MAG: hypothetical protein AAB074_21655 [Planctomycetota bacterium]